MTTIKMLLIGSLLAVVPAVARAGRDDDGYRGNQDNLSHQRDQAWNRFNQYHSTQDPSHNYYRPLGYNNTNFNYDYGPGRYGYSSPYYYGYSYTLPYYSPFYYRR